MNLYLTRIDGTYVRFDDVIATPVLIPMTGKGEPYRDIFSGTSAVTVKLPSVGAQEASLVAQPILNGGLVQATGSLAVPTAISVGHVGLPTEPNAPSVPYAFTPTTSDEFAHVAPRQGDQIYNIWQFDLGVVASQPRYLYAEFRRGDIISNVAPNTDPA